MRGQGVIQGVQIALGTGTIRPDDGTDDLPFGRDELVAGAFEELREGQWVSYALAEADPARREARAVQLLAE